MTHVAGKEELEMAAKLESLRCLQFIVNSKLSLITSMCKVGISLKKRSALEKGARACFSELSELSTKFAEVFKEDP